MAPQPVMSRSSTHKFARREVAENRVDPEVLTLRDDGCSIVSDSSPDTPLYLLGRSVLARHGVWDGQPITFERASSSGAQLFNLARSETSQFHLTPASASAPGTIELRQLQPPYSNGHVQKQHQREARFEAYVHQGAPTESQQPSDPPSWPPLLTMLPRWLSNNELNYLDANRRQLACEDGDWAEADSETASAPRRLITTVRMPAEMRDCLVAIWCLRLWREELVSKDLWKTDGSAPTPSTVGSSSASHDFGARRTVGLLAQPASRVEV